MSATASDSGHRAGDRRGQDTRRGTGIRRPAQEYERELRRHELAVGRSLTQVLPSDRPARLRELADARRALSGAIRDLRQLLRDLEVDLQRYGELRSRNQRDLLAYEAVAGEIEEVLERWEARRDQLATALERGGRRPGGGPGTTGRGGAGTTGRGGPGPGTGGRGGRPGHAGQGNRGGQATRGGRATRGGQPGRGEPGAESGRGGQGNRGGPSGRGGQPNRDGQPNRGGRPNRGGQAGRGEQPNRGGRPNRGEQGGRGEQGQRQGSQGGRRRRP